MKHKRLNRDGWGFQYYPYYQMRIDDELFHGTACLIKLTDGEANYWATPKAGRIQVTGAGMSWLELVPDNHSRAITIMYFPEGTHDSERHNYPAPADRRFQPSVYYVDIIEGMEADEYGIATFIDKYLDVIFTPERDIKVDDRDELDAAYAAGELTKEQYDDALRECESILKEYCEDISKTDAWCASIRAMVEQRIEAGEPIKPCKEVSELHNNKYMRLETERLMIRSIRRGDEKAYAEMAKDGTLTEVGFDEHFSNWAEGWIDEALALTEKDDPRADYIPCTIVLKTTGEVIGNVGCTYYDDTDRIGICYFVGTEHRGNGYVSEAVKAYLSYFFDRYDEEEIIATIKDDNVPSRKTAESCGFRLLETKMYKDINDEKEELYRFYAFRRNDQNERGKTEYDQ